MQRTGSLGDETAEKPNENNESAQFSTQRKSLPHPRQRWAKSGSRGCWAHWEAGNTVALCSRRTELLAETRLQAERGGSTLASLPPHPSTSCQRLSLGEPHWRPDVTGALHTQPARVGTSAAEKGKGAEQKTRPTGLGQHRYHYLHVHIKKQGTEKLSNLPRYKQRVSRAVGSAPRPPGSGTPSLACSGLAPSPEPLVLQPVASSGFSGFRPFPLFISAWHRHGCWHIHRPLGSDR